MGSFEPRDGVVPSQETDTNAKGVSLLYKPRKIGQASKGAILVCVCVCIYTSISFQAGKAEALA
jgi:hypothetical protein